MTDATSVRFGGQDALVYKVLADDPNTAQTPRAIDGQLLVEVTVSTPIGTSQSSTASTFAYIAAAGAWRPIHTLALVAIVVAKVILSVAIPGSSGFTPGVARQWSWIAALVLLALFIMVAGQGITDRWEGLFIDERNKITLSRLHLVLWVVLIVSAFFALALANVVLGADNPLQIAVPIEIWEVLGISMVSLVGSPLILGSKASKTPDSNQAGATMNNVAKLDNAPAAAVTNVGVVVVKTSPQYARWSDLFRGEETGNADYLDMSKIQMFFTIVLVAAYAAALFGMFASGERALHALPWLDSSMVALLAISHGAYLTNKVVPHSQTQMQ